MIRLVVAGFRSGSKITPALNPRLEHLQQKLRPYGLAVEWFLSEAR
jgi:hypothetical protein